MANRHISVPISVANGDASEWLKRFDICSRANEWSNGTKALKLLTLLEGEALATWLELSEEEQSHYRIAKKRMIEKIAPMKFVTLEEFHQRKLHPGEALPLFIHDLKKLLDRAMPDVDATARGQLLLRQFLAGLPAAVSTKWYTIGTLHRNVSIVWWPCVALSTTAGKLTPRSEGNWTVKTAKSDQHGNYGWQAKQGCSYQSTAASHSAQLHWTARRQWKQAIGPPTGWSPCVHPTRHPCTYRRYPQRDRRPSDRFSF